MPTENFSSKIGKSPSPSIERSIANSTNVQQPIPVASAIPAAHNKHPVTDISKK